MRTDPQLQVLLLDVIVLCAVALDFPPAHLLPIELDTSNLYLPVVSEPDVQEVVVTVATLL